MSALDHDAIAVVATRIHRIDGKRVCRCEVCKAIRRVTMLAREAIARREQPTRFVAQMPKHVSQAFIRGEAER